MYRNSLWRQAFPVRSLLLVSFSLLVALPEANAVQAYEEKAFLPAPGCTSVDISSDGSTIYARAHFGDWNEGVRLYSGVTYEHIKDIEHFPNVPWSILASADGNYLYASHYYGGAVVKLDVSTGQVVESIPVGPWPGDMVFDSERRFLYVGVNDPGRHTTAGWISKLDTSTDEVVGTADLNGEPGLCLTVSADGQFLYVYSRNPGTETLYKISTADLSVAATLPVPGINEPGISVSPDGNFVYLPDGAADHVRVIGTASLVELDSYNIAHVRNFSVAPSGRYAVAVSQSPIVGPSPGYYEKLVHIFDLGTRSIVDTLPTPDLGLANSGGLRYRIMWRGNPGKAYIPLSAENGGVIVLSPAGENWETIYQSDFSTDPGWTTNSPEDFYWNETDGTYHFKLVNTGEQYSYKAISFDPGASYQLEFDVYMTRCDWAADLYLGLGDPDMDITSATTWYVSYHEVDQGKTGSLIYLDSEGGSYHPGGLQPAPFQLNTWYHNLATYDATAGALSLRVTKVSDGSLVGEVELTGVGRFVGVDRLYMSSVGHHYAPGATAEGYIDNLVLKEYSEGGEWQVVYETGFAVEPGWITDQPDNYYWNESEGTYHATVENNAPEYQPNRYFYTPLSWTGDSFELQWDIKMTRADWSAGVSFGVFDETMAFAGFNGGQGLCLEFANPDAGRLLWLYVCGAGGLAGASSPGGTYAVNTLYTCKISYDPGAGEVTAELVERDSGSPVWSKSLAVPGGFTVPLVRLGGSRSGFGETGGGYSGVNRWGVAEAEIDNVVFRRPTAEPQQPVVTEFAINDGAEMAQNRVVTLNNAAENDPTHYMASENPGFEGAAWLSYSTAPEFTLSEGDGEKTVYFKTKNEAGESDPVSDSIVLQQAGWELVYSTDFSSDPGWTTNSPEDFYWNEADGNYYFKRWNTGEQYSYKSIPFDPGASYRLEFDVYITRCDWAASLYLGLGDPDMDIGSATAWHVSYHKVDQGKTASLIYMDSEGGSYHPGGLQPAPFQLNTWYNNAATYDAAAGTFSLRVTKVSDGSLVGEVELTGVGSFAGVDRLYMSSVGHHYAPGATVEGYIDNIVLRRSAQELQPPVVTQFAINDGAENTEDAIVTLNNVTENGPTHHMASENPGFEGAAWQAYSTAPEFTLSEGDGEKTVYFKTKNEAGQSDVVNDSIMLQGQLWEVLSETDFSSDPNWTTNDAPNLFWDPDAETFHGWQANTNTSYAYIPVELRSNASFRLEFDARINSVEWSAGLTFGLFDQRLMYNAGAVIEYSLVDAGYITALYAGNPSGPPDWEVSNWETGVWYRNIIEYDAESHVISFEARQRDNGQLLSELALSGIRSFPPGMRLLGVSRLHMEGYNNNAVDFSLDNITLKEHYEPPKRPIEIVRLAGPLLRISWDSEAGCEYQLLATSDLASGEWVPVGPKMGGTGAKLYIDDYVEGVGQRFYRLQVISPSAKTAEYAFEVIFSYRRAA